ncbi:MAG: hypothetical protein WDW36_005340 [Sanguina aurantia]
MQAVLRSTRLTSGVRQHAAVKPRSIVLSRAAPKKPVESAPAVADIGTAGFAAIASGLLANPIMLYSLYTLKTTGAGLPPGPGGAYGAAEGVSYLVVLGIIGWSIYTKVSTGSGLPQGPSGLSSSSSPMADTSPAPPAASTTHWAQKVVKLPAFKRGCHVITSRITDSVPELAEFDIGMANLFIQHTSASLTVNENASPDVPKDLNDSLDRIVPEGKMYRHDDEGSDDMPAHVKSSLMGCSLTIPISHGCLALGTWQGIYLNEHRDSGGPRTVVVTLQGTKRADGRKYGRSR